MRFLVDEQLPPALAEWLRLRGHEAKHVRDEGLASASDSAVLEHARQTEAIIITKDEDFVEGARVRPAPAVVWIRIGNSRNEALLHWMEALWPSLERALAAGEGLIELIAGQDCH